MFPQSKIVFFDDTCQPVCLAMSMTYTGGLSQTKIGISNIDLIKLVLIILIKYNLKGLKEIYYSSYTKN